MKDFITFHGQVKAFWQAWNHDWNFRFLFSFFLTQNRKWRFLKWQILSRFRWKFWLLHSQLGIINNTHRPLNVPLLLPTAAVFFYIINCGHFILGMKPELLAVLKLYSPFSVKRDLALLRLSRNLQSCDLPPLSQTAKAIDHWLPQVEALTVQLILLHWSPSINCVMAW